MFCDGQGTPYNSVAWSRLKCTRLSHYSIKLFQDCCYLILQGVEWRERWEVRGEEGGGWGREDPTLYTEQDLEEEIRYTPSFLTKKCKRSASPQLLQFSLQHGLDMKSLFWNYKIQVITSCNPPFLSAGAIWDSSINTSWRRQHVPIILSNTRTALVFVLEGSWLLKTKFTINWTVSHGFIMFTSNCL